MTAEDFAVAIDRPYSTVRSWCRKGWLKGAERTMGVKGVEWRIPAKLVANFEAPKRGRKPKQLSEEK